MANYPTALAERTQLLLPDAGLGERADVALDQLHQRGFVAAVDLTAYHVDRLGDIAEEEHITEFCPSDAATRFGDLDKAKGWNAKGRGFVGIYDVTAANGQSLTQRQLGALSDEDLRLEAYGWSGGEHNKYIPGADITTAYRVGHQGRALARERRIGQGDRFAHGLPLGELVIASAVALYHADPAQISLETWQSNSRAVALYERMGFGFRASKPDPRPTLQPVGTEINGNKVYIPSDGKHVGKKVVDDVRRYYVLEDHPLRAA